MLVQINKNSRATKAGEPPHPPAIPRYSDESGAVPSHSMVSMLFAMPG
jgi:hypothetical protein